MEGRRERGISTKEPRRERAIREKGDLIKRKRGGEELEKEWKRRKRRRRRRRRRRSG